MAGPQPKEGGGCRSKAATGCCPRRCPSKQGSGSADAALVLPPPAPDLTLPGGRLKCRLARGGPSTIPTARVVAPAAHDTAASSGSALCLPGSPTTASTPRRGRSTGGCAAGGCRRHQMLLLGSRLPAGAVLRCSHHQADALGASLTEHKPGGGGASACCRSAGGGVGWPEGGVERGRAAAGVVAWAGGGAGGLETTCA
jgi:hypothetical protein